MIMLKKYAEEIRILQLQRRRKKLSTMTTFNNVILNISGVSKQLLVSVEVKEFGIKIEIHPLEIEMEIWTPYIFLKGDNIIAKEEIGTSVILDLNPPWLSYYKFTFSSIEMIEQFLNLIRASGHSSPQSLTSDESGALSGGEEVADHE